MALSAFVLASPVRAAATGPATIIDINATGCDTSHPGAQRTTLHNALVASGYTVTDITTGVVPADLTGQQQVWDIRCQTALTNSEITTYTNYLVSGGSLFLMGENFSFGATRNASLISFITTMGGGSLTLVATNNSQTARAPFTGPTALGAFSYRAVGGTTTAGTGSFISTDSNGYGGAIVFGPQSMSAAPTGTLMIVWDVNFMDNDAGHTAGETALMNNMISYLATPTVITPPSSPTQTPLPPSVWLTVAGLSGAALLQLRRKRA